jgi:hypothetical protein
MATYNLWVGLISADKKESFGINDIIPIVSNHFEGASLQEQTGLWRGAVEPSVKIEVITEEEPKITELAQALKSALKQESVLVSRATSREEFI